VSSFDCIWQAEAVLGEAPWWDTETALLYWVDIDGRAVFRLDPATGVRCRFDVDHEVGCIVPRENGGFVTAIDCGLAYLDAGLTKFDIFATPEKGEPKTRFNDGKCDRRGRLWAASTDMEENEPLAALYCLHGSGKLVRETSGVIVGNGLGWSPDNSTMYFTDTGLGIIFAFDYDIETGKTDNRRVFARVDDTTGYPDGLTVDAEGYVWSAHWQGWRITRYDPDGRIDRTIDLPVPNVTSLVFGGASLDQLYVTSARMGLTDGQIGEAPLSGSLFVVDTGICGLPETRFAG